LFSSCALVLPPRNSGSQEIVATINFRKSLPGGPHKVSVLATTLWPVIKRALLGRGGGGVAGGENMDKSSTCMYMSVGHHVYGPLLWPMLKVSRVRIENRAVLGTRALVQGQGRCQAHNPNPKNSPLQSPYLASRALRNFMDMVMPCAIGNSFFRKSLPVMVVPCAILCRIINS